MTDWPSSCHAAPTRAATGHFDPGGDPSSASEIGHTVTERLLDELVGVAPTVITAVVKQAITDLRGSPPGAMPELVERLARQRLAETDPDVRQPTTGRVSARQVDR